MPIGIVTKEDFVKETNGTSNNGTVPARSVIIDSPKLGRNNKPEVPESIRAVIGQEAMLNGNHKQLAQEFNVSSSSISAYKNGATSTTTYNEGDKSLRNKNNIFRDRIVKKASRLSLRAINAITKDDIDEASLMEKVNAAKQMASIVKDMSPSDNDSGNDNRVQIIVHAPQQRRDSDYSEGNIISVD